MTSFNYKSTLIGGGLFLTGTGLAYLCYRRFFSPIEWVKVGRVSQLTVFPVKSMAGIKVKEMECTAMGPKSDERRDRHFMVMDVDSGKLITGRQLPLMVLIRANVESGILSLSTDKNSINVRLDEVVEKNDLRRVEHFEKQMTEGYDCGDAVAEWLKIVLETHQSLRLIYFVVGLYSERDVVPKKEWMLGPVPIRRDPIAYPDDGPYMILTEASLSDLNSHFDGRSFEMDRFRPSIVVEGSEPFDEDKWSEMSINGVEFVNVKPCTRCVMTLIDSSTGERSTDLNPLKKLREYRLAPGALRKVYKDSPVFGAIMANAVPGRIRIGDVVLAKYKKTPF